MPTWIRVRDTSTGHEFDIDARALAAQAGVERVPDYPVHSGPSARPRRAKHHVDKGGKPATRKSAPAAQRAGNAPEGES
jgi:hypothetical protein